MFEKFKAIFEAQNKPPAFSDAYQAGYDAGLNGSTTENSHFGWFRSVETKDQWERGYKDGKKLKS